MQAANTTPNVKATLADATTPALQATQVDAGELTDQQLDAVAGGKGNRWRRPKPVAVVAPGSAEPTLPFPKKIKLFK